VHAGELIHQSRQLRGGRVRFPQPQQIGDEAYQRSAEAGRQAAIVLALEEVDMEAEVRCRQDRMPEDRVELLVPDFGRAERILIVAPGPKINAWIAGQSQKFFYASFAIRDRRTQPWVWACVTEIPRFERAVGTVGYPD
jgi:hypothetical protein